MKILKIFLILCSILLVLNADSKYKYKHSYKNLEYLNLSEKQIKEIKGVLLDLKSEYKKFYEYKDKLEDELEDIIENSYFDEELYLQKVLDLKKRAAILETKRIKNIHKILNEEQKEEFAEHFKEWEIE